MQLADARVSERPLFSEQDRWFESAFPSRSPRRSRRAVYRQAGRVKAARPIFSAACSTSNASSAPNISWPITSARSNTRRACRRRSATSRPRRGARVIRQERLLLAVPADHHLADEVQALEVEALSGETLILSQYEEDAGFADYVTDFVAAARPMPEQVYPVRGIPTALSLAGRRGWRRAGDRILALIDDGERRLPRDRRLRAGRRHCFGLSHPRERPSRACVIEACKGLRA